MKIDKAIQTLDHMRNYSQLGKTYDELLALQLGLEALKRIKSGRNSERPYVCHLLPGETHD